MIPLKDENPITIFPFVTIGLIVLNALVFLYELSLGPYLEQAIYIFGAVPDKIVHLKNPLVIVTLITSLFFHSDFFHLAGNMLFLWVFGNNIEERLGHLRFIYFYLLCGILATLIFALTISNDRLPIIGASGAISGVMGAYFLLYPHAKILVLLPFFLFWRIVRLNAFWFLLIWILIQLYFGTISSVSLPLANQGGIAWLVHVLGFITGAILLTVFSKGRTDGSTVNFKDTD